MAGCSGMFGRMPICQVLLVHGCSYRRTPTRRERVVRTMNSCPCGHNSPLVRRCGRWRRRYPRRGTVTLACPQLGVRNSVARMARFGVRSGSVAFARFDGKPRNSRFERTGANGRERSLALAMHKVEGSSPFIRSERACKSAGAVVDTGNRGCKMAAFMLEPVGFGSLDIRRLRAAVSGGTVWHSD